MNRRSILTVSAIAVLGVAVTLIMSFARSSPDLLSGSPTTETTSGDSSKPSGGNAQVQVRPWGDAQALLTLNDGRVVEVRAETFSNCISVAHGLTLESGQSVEFEQLKGFDVLRADPWSAPNAKAKLRITFLNGKTAEDSVAANCDLFGYNDLGRFTTFFEKLKRVEFQR